MAIEAQWMDDMPSIYDRCLGPVLFTPFAEHVAAISGELAPRQVLEIAAGTGIVTAGLTSALPSATIVATDLNPAMVAFGSRRVPSAQWQVADALSLELPSDRFDLIVCQFGVMFFPDRVAAFAEMARVLTPKGTVLLAVWDRLATSTLTAAAVEAVDAVTTGAVSDFVTRIPHGYTDPDRIEADLHAGGLRIDRIDRVVKKTHAPSARQVAEGFCLGTPLRFALESEGPVEDITEAVAEEMTRRLGAGPITGEAAALIVTAGPITQSGQQPVRG